MPEPTPIVAAQPARGWRLFVRTRLLERTVRRLPRTSAVLDVGCGWGFYFRVNPHAAGIDGDPECVAALARQGYDVRVGDLREPLPFRSGRFEVAIAHDVLEHFATSEARAIATEVHRVLAPGGLFVVIVPNRKGFDLGLKEGVGHVTYVTAATVAELSGGLFTVERAYPEPLPRWLGRFFAHNKEVFLLRRG